MNMKIMTGVVFALAAGFAFAEVAETNKVESAAEKRARFKAMREESRQRFIEQTGGEVLKPGTQKGNIRFFNVQRVVKSDDLQKPVETIRRQFKYDIAIEDVQETVSTIDDALKLVKGRKADIGVVIVEMPGFPSLIAMPGECCSIVNITALDAGKIDAAFLKNRVRKEMVRGFAFIAGAASSRYEGNLMSPIRSLDDLDSSRGKGLPVDVLGRVNEYLTAMGIEEGEYALYAEACQAGWAPAPTNDIQKAIWDRVRETPKSPIKIEYNEKRDKGK